MWYIVHQNIYTLVSVKDESEVLLHLAWHIQIVGWLEKPLKSFLVCANVSYKAACSVQCAAGELGFWSCSERFLLKQRIVNRALSDCFLVFLIMGVQTTDWMPHMHSQ